MRGFRTNDRIYALPNKFYEWGLVSRATTGSFHFSQGLGDQVEHMHTQYVAAKKKKKSLGLVSLS